MTLKDWLDNPVSEALGLVMSIGAFLDPATFIGLFALIWAKISTVFTMLSLAAFTIAPNVDALNAFVGILQGLAIAAAVVMVLKLGSRLKNTDT